MQSDVEAFVTVMNKSDKFSMGEVGRPKCWRKLRSVMNNWHKHAVHRLCEARAIAHDEIWYENSGFSAYLESSVYDHHLRSEAIIPYLWIEACGVCDCPSGTRIPGLGGHLKRVQMQYMTSESMNTLRGKLRTIDSDGCISGPSEILSVTHWSPRLQGATYVASSRFSDANGYSAVRILTSSPAVPWLADSVSLAREGTNLEERLWLRGDCPVPHNGEASIVGDEIACMELRRSEGTNLFSHDCHTAIVNISVSSLSSAVATDDDIKMVRNRSRSALCMLCEYYAPLREEPDDEIRMLAVASELTQVYSALPTVGPDTIDQPPAPNPGGPNRDTFGKQHQAAHRNPISRTITPL